MKLFRVLFLHVAAFVLCFGLVGISAASFDSWKTEFSQKNSLQEQQRKVTALLSVVATKVKTAPVNSAKLKAYVTIFSRLAAYQADIQKALQQQPPVIVPQQTTGQQLASGTVVQPEETGNLAVISTTTSISFCPSASTLANEQTLAATTPGQDFFVGRVTLQFDHEKGRLQEGEMIFDVPAGQQLAQGILSVALYASDCKTLLARKEIATDANRVLLTDIGLEWLGTKGLFLAVEPRFGTDLQALKDIRVKFQPTQAWSVKRGKLMEIANNATWSPAFNVVQTGFPTLSLQAKDKLFNGEVTLGVITIPVQGDADYQVLLKKLQPRISATPGITLSDIRLERRDVGANAEFLYAELAAVTFPWAGNADRHNLLIEPGTTAQFYIRADVAGVTETNSAKIVFTQNDISFCAYDVWENTCVGPDIKPAAFSREIMLYND